MTEAVINLPPKLIPVFSGNARFRCAYGGRGSGKSFSFAKMTAVRGYMHGASGKTGQILCAREFMNSLEDSAFLDVKRAILSEPWLAEYYEVGEKFIRSKDGRIRYVFAGLSRNLDSIKSKADVIICWVDEAESVSEVAWRKLRPTVREAGSEVWVTWNPESPDSSTHRRYREAPPDNMRITEINWRDNPWWTDELEQERVDEMKNRPDTYDHVYEGKFLTMTEAQVFAGKYVVEQFYPDPDWDGPYQGLDFGFAQDPTAAVRCYIRDGALWVHREAGKVKLELDDTADFVNVGIPDFHKYVSRADSARPESISYLKRHGLPRIEGVEKWQGSVEDGVAFIKSFNRVVISPDCPEVAREFRLYSYKVDRLSGDVLPKILDANNHYIDACVAEGELVHTERGLVPIEEVVVGDKVMTRKGYKPVSFAGVTDVNRDVVRVTTENRSVLCTPDHRIYTERGWTRADALRYDDIILEDASWQNQKLQSGMEKPIAGGLDLIEGRTGNTFKGISAEVLSTFTGQFGSLRMAQSQMGTTFTTLTATAATTPLPTWSAYPTQSTLQGTSGAQSVKSDKRNTLIQSGHLQAHGMPRRKGLIFTGRMERLYGIDLSLGACFASTAIKNSCLELSAIVTSIAATHASQRRGGSLGPMMLNLSALSADAKRCAASTQGLQPVRARVLSVESAGIAKRVYDLTVPECPEFFAGGVLVHNCRYALAPMIKTKPKLRIRTL